MLLYRQLDCLGDEKMISYLKKQTLSTQISMIFVFFLAIMTIITLICNFLISYVNREHIQNQLSEAVKLFENNIETEFERSKRLSLSISINQSIQNLCYTFETASEFSEKFEASSMLQKQLQLIVSPEIYSRTIMIFDSNYKKIAGDSDLIFQQNIDVAKYLHHSLSTDDGFLWDASFAIGHIALCRPIYKIELPVKQVIGYVVIDINLESMITALNISENLTNSGFFITDGKDVLVSSIPFSQKSLLENIDLTKKSNMLSIDGGTYLVASSQTLSNNCGNPISCFMIIPYTNISNFYKTLNLIILISLFPLCILLFIMSFYISKFILKPISMLSEDIELMKDGHTDIISPHLVSVSNSKNELINFQNSFYILIEKLNNYIERTYQYDLENKTLEINMLYSQINPHFLYNTLDSAYWLSISNENEEAANIILLLGRLLRSSLDKETSLVTVGQELAFVRQYIGIQKIRYGDRLSIKFSISDEIEDKIVPKFILQPLIENSIKYVLEQTDKECKILIDIFCVGNDITMSVSDNGPIVLNNYYNPLLEGKYSGIAITNIQRRIQLMCFEGSTISFFINDNDMFESKVLIKYDTKGL